MTPFSLPAAPSTVSFRTCESVRDDLRGACTDTSAPAEHTVIGESEEGRPMDAFRLGRGPHAVSLIAGNHADEPVGPETLRTLVLAIVNAPEAYEALLEHVTFYIVPHTNPDGEARNRAWIDAWPDMGAYLKHVSRDLPGRDLEFGFPGMRVENRAVADFLLPHAPFALHASLHGMSVSEGALLLINRPWAFRTEALQRGYRQAAGDAGLEMHDHNRKGEKGFFWIAPGFQTTPRGDAMRSYFRSIGDDGMAERFHSSSMEMIMNAGGDPLCLVTELPLWTLRDGPETPPDDPMEPHQPHRYNAFRDQSAPLRHKNLGDSAGSTIQDAFGDFDLEPLDPSTAMSIQLRTLELALEMI
jgi:hypothetical protein